MNVDALLEVASKGKCIEEKDVKQLCEKVAEILMDESNILRLSSPINVCGDIHGQL